MLNSTHPEMSPAFAGGNKEFRRLVRRVDAEIAEKGNF